MAERGLLRPDATAVLDRMTVVSSLLGAKAASAFTDADIELLRWVNGGDHDSIPAFRSWGLSDSQILQLIGAMKRDRGVHP